MKNQRHNGKKNRPAHTNFAGILAGALLLAAGIICLVLKAFGTEYIDQQGILHENFFLLPIGFLLIFGGFICLGVVLIKALLCKKH